MTDWLLNSTELAILRRAFARQMLGLAGVADDRLEAAFATVPREAFLESGSWEIQFPFSGFVRRLPSNDPVHAYQDVLFRLAPERGVNNGSPSLHARMLSGLACRPGQRVAHIGAGTGYYSAILAALVGPQGHVTAVEYDGRLAALARRNLAPWRNVAVAQGDGVAWPMDGVDRIYVNFAVSRPAAPWIERLDPNGVLVFPLGVPAAAAPPDQPKHAARGAALRIERVTDGFAARSLGPAFFVCAEGGLSPDPESGQTLLDAFERGGLERVQSLRWQQAAEPSRCWYRSHDWSLCFDPPAG